MTGQTVTLLQYVPGYNYRKAEFPAEALFEYRALRMWRGCDRARRREQLERLPLTTK